MGEERLTHIMVPLYRDKGNRLECLGGDPSAGGGLEWPLTAAGEARRPLLEQRL